MLCASQILGAYGDLVAGYFSRDDARTLSAVSKYFTDCRSALAQAEACEREVIQRTDAAVGMADGQCETVEIEDQGDFAG